MYTTRDTKGKRNPNYKHGKYCIPSICACGRVKDERSRSCALCARCGFSVSGEPVVTDTAVAEAVRTNNTILKAARQLGISRQTVTRVVNRLRLDTRHFKHGRGRPYTHEELFRDGHTRRVAQTRHRFKQLNSVPHTCSSCGLPPEWLGKPLRLDLHHVNGDCRDNRLVNLTWLCPNCHSQDVHDRGSNYHRYTDS